MIFRLAASGHGRHTLGALRQMVMAMPPEEASLERRGFAAGRAEVRRHLERVLGCSLHTYNLALAEPNLERLIDLLELHRAELRPFAYEGAALAQMVLEVVFPWNRGGVDRLVQAAGVLAIPCYAGAGAGLAFFRRRPQGVMQRLDDRFYRWQFADGYGFYNAFYRTETTVGRQRRPRSIDGDLGREFDAGIGRCLWFMAHGDLDWLGATADTFSPDRRADLWTGIGLACAFAGGVDPEGVHGLRRMAGEYRLQTAQGAALAAFMGHRFAIAPAHTEMACRVLCNLSADDAQRLAETARHAPTVADGVPASRQWRNRLGDALSRVVDEAPDP